MKDLGAIFGGVKTGVFRVKGFFEENPRVIW
jgi:hypothetical protein